MVDGNARDINQSSTLTIRVPLDDLINKWFMVLTFQERKTLEYLYLYSNGFSINAVSRIIGVSSRKVVNFQQRAFKKLRESETYIIAKPLMTLLHTFTVEKADISISESQLEIALQRNFIVGRYAPLGIVRLIFALEEFAEDEKKGHSKKRLESGKVNIALPGHSEPQVSERPEQPFRKPVQTQSSKDITPQQEVINDTGRDTFSDEKTSFLQDDESPIKSLGLSRRVYNALYRGGIRTVGQLASLKAEELLNLRNIGETSLAEIEKQLNDYLSENPHLVYYSKLESSSEELQNKAEENVNFTENAPPISSLNMSRRAYNALVRTDIRTLSQLINLSDAQLEAVKHVGPKTVKEIRIKLKDYLTQNPYVQKQLAIEKPISQSNHLFIAPEVLSQVETIPLNRISIERLGLSTSVNNRLTQQGINTIGQLLQQVDEIVDDGTIEMPFNRYLTWLIEQDEAVWLDEGANNGISPLLIIDLAALTIEEMINAWLDPLSDRQRNVIYGRFGLYGEEWTLQEIGEQLGVSRERVRQIQKKALRTLEYQYQHRRKNQLKPLIAHLHQIFTEQGGLLNNSEIITLLESNDIVRLGNIDPVGTVLLICEMDAHFHYFKKQHFATLSKYSTDAIISVQACFIEILEKELTPIPGDVLLMEFKKTAVYTSYKDWQTDYPDDFFIACLRVHPEIEQLDSGRYTLAKWSKKRLGAIVSVLRKIGEPAHYSVIAEKTNELLPPDQQFSVRDVHSWLGRYSDIFVWVRLRGTYGLKEWGLERDLSYVDACAQILENVGHPLTFEQIMGRLPEVRQFFDESSVLITLGTHERFYTFSNNRYGLAEWTTTQSKADFSDLFGSQLARRQDELDQKNKNAEIDAQKEVDTIRKLGLDFFSD